jgi:hypothetical protein
MPDKNLQLVLDKLSEMDKKLNKISSIEKRLKSIEKDISVIKNCVDSENAEEFPYVPKNGSTTTIRTALAAKSK